MTIAVYSIILVLLIGLSMFFSSADMAFGSVSLYRLESEKKTKKRDLAIKLSRGYDKTISTILLFNDTVNAALDTVSTLLGILIAKEWFNVLNPDVQESYGLICSLIFLIIGALSSLLLSRGITRPVVHLTRKIESIEDTRTVDLAAFSGLSGPPEIRRLNTSFGDLIRRVNRLTGQIQKAAEQRRISELRALQAQMNPHFVLNAMNTVNYMALMRGQDDIAATVDSIASLMRYSITDPDKLVSIHTEVENIREYISIYTLRFRQEIRLEISADRPDTEIFIPKFTLQPLVENSIRHGITRQDAGITVFLRAWEDEDRLYVQVTDTGRGADPDKLNAYLRYEDVDLKVSHGFGIRNVNERIQLHFGGDSGLTFSIDTNGRLAATLTICTAKKSAPDNKI